MQRLETQNTQLQQQVSSLSEQTTYLAKQVPPVMTLVSNQRFRCSGLSLKDL
jgi:hypothetical protein